MFSGTGRLRDAGAAVVSVVVVWGLAPAWGHPRRVLDGCAVECAPSEEKRLAPVVGVVLLRVVRRELVWVLVMGMWQV